MTMLKRCLILGVLLSLLPLSFAQGDNRDEGDKACGSDARRHCKKVLDQGDSAVLACLQANEKKLSKPCHKFLVEQGQL